MAEQLDKKVLDHDLPKKSSLLVLFFRVKFYLESIALTKDKTAVELFYMQAKMSVCQNEIEISSDLLYELTALVLQSLYGDYKNDADSLKMLKTTPTPLLPKTFLLSPSSTQKERKIIAFYKKCNSMNRGQCIVNYLSIIEKLNNYGVHYYEVKDKSNVKWYLGISFRGIGLYEIGNKITPKKLFLWSKLENLYYRDRKFSIEVHETSLLNQVKENQISNHIPTTNTTNAINATAHLTNDNTFNPVKVYAWFASIPSLCKSIWLMAVSQHQFYLDKKQNKDILIQFKSLNDLASELTQSANENTTHLTDVDQQMMTNNANGTTNPNTNTTTTDDAFNEKSQMLFLLKKKQEILNQQLNVKKTISDKIRMKQQDIVEMSKLIGEDKSCIYSVVSMVSELKCMLNELEQNKHSFQLILDEEYETQKKIMFIALNLASDPNATSIVQKARRDFYEKSKLKFAKLEMKRENDLKLIDNGLAPTSVTSTSSCSSSSSLLKPASQHHHSHSQNHTNNHNGSNSSSKHSQLQTKLNSYFNDDVISMFDSISPASIHRKDSYRRAQEQKLFLENNMNLINKTNRNINGRRVKNIWNENQRDNEFSSTRIANGDNVFVNNLYGVKNFKEDILDVKSKSVSPNEFISSSNGEMIVSFETAVAVNNHTSNGTNELKLKKEMSNLNCKYVNAECIENLNNQITEVSLKGKICFS